MEITKNISEIWDKYNTAVDRSNNCCCLLPSQSGLMNKSLFLLRQFLCFEKGPSLRLEEEQAFLSRTDSRSFTLFALYVSMSWRLIKHRGNCIPPFLVSTQRRKTFVTQSNRFTCQYPFNNWAFGLCSSRKQLKQDLEST
jgi:hypothetical protein